MLVYNKNKIPDKDVEFVDVFIEANNRLYKKRVSLNQQYWLQNSDQAKKAALHEQRRDVRYLIYMSNQPRQRYTHYLYLSIE